MSMKEVLPEELSEVFLAAKVGAPAPDAAMRDRVLARVQATIGNPPPGGSGSGTGGTSVPGALGAGAAAVKGAMLVLLAVGAGYWAIHGTQQNSDRERKPRPVQSTQPSLTEVVPPPSLEATRKPNASEALTRPSQDQAPEKKLRAESAKPRAAKRGIRRRKQVPVESPTADPLMLELELLAKARSAMKTPRAALRHLAAHRRTFPAGQLAEERELLRARAHLALGEVDVARRVARQFLEQFLGSAGRREMEEICEL